ncbi:MAG: hypothetical protein RBU45_11485 [Myxococcota bacterium]|jgi:hypothetical protein|nr:hypothetical protein [Myxococcota bacterium]
MAETTETRTATGRLASPERLAAKHQQALFGDYFQLLELERSADELAVARALTRIAAEFDPLRLPASATEEQVTRTKLVAAVALDAAAVLGDRTLREQYASRLRPAR